MTTQEAIEESKQAEQRLVRRFPIDFRAIAAETGCTQGTIVHNAMFGWHVQNGNGPADFCVFTPPEITDGETLRIENREWAIYPANNKRSEPPLTPLTCSAQETPTPRVYSHEYDADYNPETGEWLEGVCGHPECKFCADRPATAPVTNDKRSDRP